MQKVTKKQIAMIHVLLSKMNMQDYKSGIVLEYTYSRTDSVKEMTLKEGVKMIGDMQNHLNKKINDTDERQRRYIIAMAHQMGWQLENGKIDKERLNAWIQKYGHQNVTDVHKTLNDYKKEDLNKLVSQFQKVLRSYLKSLGDK